MKVALDIDDVLAGFYPGMCDKYDRPELKINIWDGDFAAKWVADNFSKIEANKFFWLGLPIISNPRAIAFEVECYITSSPKEMVNYRIDWLVQNGFPIRPVYHSTNKLETMRELGIDIIVDDKPSTVNSINQSEDKKALQFKPSYMSAEIEDKSKIITHLSQVNKFL
jgi:hypothetical protein|tara:strand:- start:1683 stop:2183 length:501 start_codon:yes stop_codon:yes gene_type:complete